jgi:hypothetical protein
MKANRELFQLILETAAKGSIANPRSRQATPSASTAGRRRGPAPSPGDDSVRETTRAVALRSQQKRPNVHAGLHYEDAIREYASASNANVLISEDKHRDFKDQIYNTNYQNPERDLLQQQGFEMSVRLLLQGGYPDFPELSEQMSRLHRTNPQLFDGILPRSEKASADIDAVTDGAHPRSDPNHTGVLVGDRILGYHCRDFLKLPTSGSNLDIAFEQDLTATFSRTYAVTASAFDKPISWWKRFSFDDRYARPPTYLLR